MANVLRIIGMTIAAAVVGFAAFLATVSGVIDAVGWACNTFGTVPVGLAGAFIAGGIIMHAVDRGLAERQQPGA